MTSAIPNRAEFRDQMTALLGSAPAEGIVEFRLVDLEADVPPWVDTGLTVCAGDRVTLILCGRIYIDETSDIWLDPAMQIWARVGGRGPILRGSRATHTFTCAHDGALELGNASPAEWTDTDGGIGIDPALYGFMAGGTTVVILRGAPAARPADVLRGLPAEGHLEALVDGEVERLDLGLPRAPAGWEPLWFVGPTEVYAEDDTTIICHTHGDVAVICRDAPLALTPDTTLTWSWKVDQLPSSVAEDSFATHDYLSIAVEFDNGQDLTYQWSAALPTEMSYRCPLPNWSERETHLVVRSGTGDLGRWLDERRNVLADYTNAVGGPIPLTVTRIWLIAVSCFQHGEGRCAYADIDLVNA